MKGVGFERSKRERVNVFFICIFLKVLSQVFVVFAFNLVYQHHLRTYNFVDHKINKRAKNLGRWPLGMQENAYPFW